MLQRGTGHRQWITALSALAWISCAIALPVHARSTIGIYGAWGAFVEPDGPRCHAIAEPARTSPGGRQRAFVAVAVQPRGSAGYQILVRSSRPMTGGAMLTVGSRRFPLVADGNDWTLGDLRQSTAAIAAIRNGRSMSISGTSTYGVAFADSYALRGAASAIDAAVVRCRTGT